jgi:hypothetical protein
MPTPNESILTQEEYNALYERLKNVYSNDYKRIDEILNQAKVGDKVLTKELYNKYFPPSDTPLKSMQTNSIFNPNANIGINEAPPKLVNNINTNSIVENSKNTEQEYREEQGSKENKFIDEKKDGNSNSESDISRKIFDSADAELKEEPTLNTQLENIKNTQLSVETGRLGSDIYNLIRELSRGTSVPYKGPTLSFTPTPSSRDMMKAELNRDISSGEAKMMRFIESQGLTDAVGGVLAQSNEAINKGTAQIASNELQRISSDAQRFDQYRNMQSQADAQTFNLNVQKQAQENQISGQLIGALQDRIYNNITDVNRQNYEYAKIKKFLDENNNSVTSLIEAENYLRAKFPDLYE